MKKDSVEENPPTTYKTSTVILLAINAALGAIFFGYVISVFNPTQRYIQEKVYPGISNHVMYFMTSFTSIGGAIGAVTSTFLASKYGRRRTMILVDILAIIGVIFTVITNQYVLLVGRVVCGICIGLNSSLVPLYISEISPLELKGVTGTFSQIFVSIGILISYLLGLGIPTENSDPPSQWWRFMLGVIIAAPVLRLFVLSLFVRHETPFYLVQGHNYEEAHEALKQLYKEDTAIESQLELLKKEVRFEETKVGITYQDLVSPFYRRRFIVGCLLAILQQACGINAIIMYSTEIFRKGVLLPDDNAPQIYTVVVGVVNLLSAFLAIALVSGTGRKTLLLIGNILLFASLLALSIFQFTLGSSAEISRYCIFIYILAFGFSLGAVTYMYLPEILPDLGVGVAMLCNWIVCFFVAQGFPYMVGTLGEGGAFLIFDAICLLGVLFIIFFVKETRNKNSLEIAEMFAKRRPNGANEEAGLLLEEEKAR